MRSKAVRSVLFVVTSSCVIGLLGAIGPGAGAVTIDWVTVGDPGNAADTTGYGSVSYTYRISKYEVTNAQYAEFLNAVADTDTYDLYSTHMGNPDCGAPGYTRCGGITRSGSAGSYTYSTIAGRENMPVNWVTFWDALRFANWLHNGQPVGAQGNDTTEDGAYTITYWGIYNNTITRNADATIFLTSEDEWYKAAYFNGTSYFDYPAGSDTPTGRARPGATPNTANCGYPVVGDFTDVGSYTGSASPYGTFDQGGNAWEWNESIIPIGARSLRGGGFLSDRSYLAASYRGNHAPTLETSSLGFRVAMIPEPGTAMLLAGGLVGLAAARRRRSLHRV